MWRTTLTMLLSLASVWGCGRIGYSPLEGDDDSGRPTDGATDAPDGGADAPTPGRVLWFQVLDGSGDTNLNGLTLDGDDIVVAGSFRRSLAWGPTPHVSVGAGDVIVAAVRSDGEPLWSKSWGSAQQEEALSVVHAPSVGLVVLGSTEGIIDADGRLVGGRGRVDGFVLVLTSAGSGLAAETVGGAAGDGALAAVPTSAGVRIAGYARGDITWGGVSVPSTGQQQGFVAQLDADLTPGWIAPISPAGVGSGSLSTDGAGDTFFAHNTPVMSDLTMARLDATGGIVWTRGVATSTVDIFAATVFTPQGPILVGSVGGEFDSSGNLRLGTMMPVISFDDVGTPTTLAVVESTGPLVPHAVAWDSGRNVVVVGGRIWPLLLPDGSVVGAADAKPTLFTTTLEGRIASYWAPEGEVRASGLAVGPDGSLFVCGALEGIANIDGLGTFGRTGEIRAFIARIEL